MGKRRPELFDLDIAGRAYGPSVSLLIDSTGRYGSDLLDTGQRWLSTQDLAAQSGPCTVVTPAALMQVRERKAGYFARMVARSPGHQRGRAARAVLTREVLESLYARGWSNARIASWLQEQIGHIGAGSVSYSLVIRIARECDLNPATWRPAAKADPKEAR